MDAVLHRIEALPGDGRYALTFRSPDGTEQTAVVHTEGDEVRVAAASLPAGWARGSDAYLAAAAAVLALDRARTAGPRVALLRDVDGGWDVSMGNVVLSAADLPECTAHGELRLIGADVYACGECGARAGFGFGVGLG